MNRYRATRINCPIWQALDWLRICGAMAGSVYLEMHTAFYPAENLQEPCRFGPIVFHVPAAVNWNLVVVGVPVRKYLPGQVHQQRTKPPEAACHQPLGYYAFCPITGSFGALPTKHMCRLSIPRLSPKPESNRSRLLASLIPKGTQDKRVGDR